MQDNISVRHDGGKGDGDRVKKGDGNDGDDGDNSNDGDNGNNGNNGDDDTKQRRCRQW